MTTTLDNYTKFIKNNPVLDAEEHDEILAHWLSTKSPEAKKKLIDSYQRLVLKLALKFKGVSVMDLVQEGNIGLIIALDKYNPSLQVPLVKFLPAWIKAYMLRYITNNSHVVKFATTPAKRKIFWKLSKAQKKLSQGGVEPSVEELAAYLKVPAETIKEVAGFSVESLEDRTYYEVDNSIETMYQERQQQEKISDAMQVLYQDLNDKYKIVLERRFGKIVPDTLDQIGFDLGLSRQRIQQMEKTIQKKIEQLTGKV